MFYICLHWSVFWYNQSFVNMKYTYLVYTNLQKHNFSEYKLLIEKLFACSVQCVSNCCEMTLKPEKNHLQHHSPGGSMIGPQPVLLNALWYIWENLRNHNVIFFGLCCFIFKAKVSIFINHFYIKIRLKVINLYHFQNTIYINYCNLEVRIIK